MGEVTALLASDDNCSLLGSSAGVASFGGISASLCKLKKMGIQILCENCNEFVKV